MFQSLLPNVIVIRMLKLEVIESKLNWIVAVFMNADRSEPGWGEVAVKEHPLGIGKVRDLPLRSARHLYLLGRDLLLLADRDPCPVGKDSLEWRGL